MLSKDVCSMNIGIQRLAFIVVPWESLFRVWNIESTINGTFQGSKDLSTGGGSGETNVQAGSECSGTIIIVFNTIHLSVDISVALVDRVEAELLEDSSSQEQSSAVACSIVGKPNFNSISGQLMTVSSANNDVSFKSSIGNLAADVSVGRSDNHPVLGCIILVLVLNYKTFASIEISLSFTPPAELDLETLEVSLVLNNLDERHGDL